MPRGDQYYLRQYFAEARIDHRCDFCMSDILSGQEYEGQVWVMNGHFFVLKRHSDPTCPDDWWNRDSETESESETQEVAKAA